MVVKASLAEVEHRRSADRAGPRRPEPARRTCVAGVTAGGTCASCCLFSPRWLFLYPGLIAMAVGAVATAVLEQGTLAVGRVEFDIASMIYTAALLIVGYQAVLFWLITKVYAAQAGFLPMTGRSRERIRSISVERGLLAGFCIFVAGLFIGLAQVWRWNGEQFGQLDPSQSIRAAVPAMLGLVLGSQTTMYAMFVGTLGVADPVR